MLRPVYNFPESTILFSTLHDELAIHHSTQSRQTHMGKIGIHLQNCMSCPNNTDQRLTYALSDSQVSSIDQYY